MGRLIFILSLLCGCLAACVPVVRPYQWQLPQGFPKPSEPVDNPMSEAKVQLGRALFYDVNLSANQTMSCSSCHQQQFGFSEPRTTAKGSSGGSHRRNSQPLVNVAYNVNLTWAHSGLTELEQQILIPMFGETPVEMGITGNETKVLQRFDTLRYLKLFDAAFPGEEVNFDLLVKALASFVRSLISFSSPFDRYAYFQDDNALSESAIRGLNLFFSERLECHHCHGGLNFTQSSKHEFQQLDLRPFHNTGLYSENSDGAYPKSDQGLIEITLDSRDMGRFRAPTLRNVAVSAPYMHDGSIKTLSEVIDLYAAGGSERGRHNPLKSVFLHGFELTTDDKQDLLAFLHSLTDQDFLTNPQFAEE